MKRSWASIAQRTAWAGLKLGSTSGFATRELWPTMMVQELACSIWARWEQHLVDNGLSDDTSYRSLLNSRGSKLVTMWRARYLFSILNSFRKPEKSLSLLWARRTQGKFLMLVSIMNACNVISQSCLSPIQPIHYQLPPVTICRAVLVFTTICRK